jgi:hypothetical protein
MKPDKDFKGFIQLINLNKIECIFVVAFEVIAFRYKRYTEQPRVIEKQRT